MNQQEKHFYKVEVECGGESDWLKINKLPVKDIMHMAYYLDHCVKLNFNDDDGKFQYVSLAPLTMSMGAFERKM